MLLKKTIVNIMYALTVIADGLNNHVLLIPDNNTTVSREGNTWI